MYALNSLRLEKGYRAWKGDLSTDYSLLEGGMERFIKFLTCLQFGTAKKLLVKSLQVAGATV